MIYEKKTCDSNLFWLLGSIYKYMQQYMSHSETNVVKARKQKLRKGKLLML